MNDGVFVQFLETKSIMTIFLQPGVDGCQKASALKDYDFMETSDQLSQVQVQYN